MPAIYLILNRHTGKGYIGSSVDERYRWRRHRWMLNHDEHDNIHLQRAWHRDGSEAFQFMILEHPEPDQLLIREQFYLDRWPRHLLYNFHHVAGKPPPNTGKRLTPEWRAKIGEHFQGKPLSADHREKIAAALRGRPKSAEQRAKQAQAMTGRTASPATRAKMAATHRGRPRKPSATD